jgi:hypothetical protein
MTEDPCPPDDPAPVNNFICRVLVAMILAVLVAVGAAIAIVEITVP